MTKLPLIALALFATATAADARKREIPAATPVGEAVDCLRLSDIRETRVRSDEVIDFVTRGGKVYRNTLPAGGCPSLGFEERFLYKTSLAQLCSVDTITVLRSPPLSQGPSCGLGKFQPVQLAKAAR